MYSGQSFHPYPYRSDDPGWNPTEDWINIERTWYKATGVALAPPVDGWFDRTQSNFSRCVYAQMYWKTVSDNKDMAYCRVRIYQSGSPTGGSLKETFYIDKTVDTCVDDEIRIMFRDSLNQWSFFLFTKKNSTTINTEPERAETSIGRFRYNVNSSDTLTLNTDWMPDEQNDLVRDLLATEQCYLVAPSDGSLEPLTVVPTSLRIQTSRNEGLHQYTIQFRKSIDNFAP
jgi:hypothetical protein